MAQKKKSKKLRVINQEYYNQQTAQNAVTQKQLALTRKHRMKMLILCGVMLVITIMFGFNIIQNNIQAAVLGKKTREARVELKSAKQQNQKLNQRVAELKDSDYLAKIIRKKYFFSKDGETIYSLPSDKAKTVTEN
ncbi:FtsB family cell division protein [Ligilactobacillus aviarius]|uniref:FtsB family cell division protein n=1 Tax=Ligilactobacillus aviarius TaxID=1606 RepID=UPI00388DD1C6